MSDTVIRVENLSKEYKLGLVVHDKLADLISAGAEKITDGIKKLLNIPKPDDKIQSIKKDMPEYIWAIKDISFEVKQGEIVGIIGKNGSGKSTLLKILTGITEPTKGRVWIKGRVGSLLEVGTGFHPELTGRENVFLNGAILGMARTEIKKKFDEIVAFAEIEKFIDTPVKRYSSGMYVRLAFAVAAHLEPEILLVDEVLAVGDASFQKKCLGKMGDVAKEGRTILFVSHNMTAIQQLCSHGVLLEQGNIILDGNIGQVLLTYLKQSQKNLQSYYKNSFKQGIQLDKSCLLESEVLDSDGKQCQYVRFGEPFSIRMIWKHYSNIQGLAYAIRIYDSHNRLLCAMNTLNVTINEDKGIHEVICKFEYNIFIPQEYYISIGSYIRPHTAIHVVDPCLKLIVEDIAYNKDNPFTILGSPLFVVPVNWEQSNVK